MTNEIAVAPKSSTDSLLVELALRPDFDPDKLEKIVKLKLQMDAEQARKDFQEAMANFQGECPPIRKVKKVDFTSKSGTRTNYEYAPLDELTSVAGPVLAKHGLSFSFDMKPIEGQNEMANLLTKISHRNGHAEVFTWEYKKFTNDERLNESQRRKSALSFAKRAALENALGVVTTGEDDDARRSLDTVITQDQLDEIQTLLKGTKTDEATFKKYVGVAEFGELDQHAAKKAILALKAKRAKNV